MRNLQELVSSKEIAFGVNFVSTKFEMLKDFIEYEVALNTKFWNQEEGLMYYKTKDDNNKIIVFYLISGKAHLESVC